MKAKFVGVMVLTAVPLLASCSLLGTTLDYSKAESEIAKSLNEAYGADGVKVDSVACDQAGKRPKPGSTFLCKAEIGAATVPVEVTVKDEDMNIAYKPTKKLYDLAKVGPTLQPDVQKQVKVPVTISCGTGMKAAAPGETFPCELTDGTGEKAGLNYKVGPMDGADSWAPRQD
ncbi:DUF4333 domain-containing protein [Tsukamurella paurometabola]|nr:DUF4333 domain-containing protein [Tsukamurella paurometabola]